MRGTLERLRGTVFVLALLLAGPLAAYELGALRLGALKFGTVNWELDVIRTNGLDAEEGFTLEVQGYGGGEATNVALMGGAVDGIVDDWIWVSRQRAAGIPLVFAVPYSHTVGALVVHGDSGIDSLDQLAGRKIGIAGGPFDKSRLLVQAVAGKHHGIALADVAELAFGAPPLLNQKFLSGELDSVLNYWHFVARLEAAGHRRLLNVSDAQAELGVPPTVPQLGYVFQESFVEADPELVKAFARASYNAKRILRDSDAEWERIRPLTKAKNDAELETLERRFREGTVESWGDEERKLAARLAADPQLMPGPAAVVARMTAEARSGELFFHLGTTLARVAASFLAATLAGTALGLPKGRRRLADELGGPWLVFFLNLPALVTIVLAYI